MMDRSKWLLTFCLLSACLWATQLVSYSDGPPTGRTGAPGELTCYNGSCHNSFPLNSGPGEPHLSIDTPEGGYVPGEVYQIKARIRQDSMLRFGMEMITYSAMTDASIGILQSPPDSTGLELVTDDDRSYIRHFDATEASDSNTWIINWQAPDPGSGPVGIYAAFVASNRNGNRQGDYVYTTQLQLAESEDSLSTGLPALAYAPNLQIFSVEDQLHISAALQMPLMFEIAILDLQGKPLYHLQDAAPAGPYQLVLPLQAVPSGIYLVRIQHTLGQVMHKIYLRRD